MFLWPALWRSAGGQRALTGLAGILRRQLADNVALLHADSLDHFENALTLLKGGADPLLLCSSCRSNYSRDILRLGDRHLAQELASGRVPALDMIWAFGIFHGLFFANFIFVGFGCKRGKRHSIG